MVPRKDLAAIQLKTLVLLTTVLAPFSFNPLTRFEKFDVLYLYVLFMIIKLFLNILAELIYVLFSLKPLGLKLFRFLVALFVLIKLLCKVFYSLTEVI